MTISSNEKVEYFREFMKESDRVVVIASVARLDHMLLECLTCLAQQNGDVYNGPQK